jgi:Rieske [2Fe-2S] domain
MEKHKAETLVRTGPGTAMGNLLRRYWVPVLMSREIAEPDSPQMRVQILGEKLLVFRDTDGEVGLIDEFCSHRGVSLYFGRNGSANIFADSDGATARFPRQARARKTLTGSGQTFRSCCSRSMGIPAGVGILRRTGFGAPWRRKTNQGVREPIPVLVRKWRWSERAR